MTVIIGLLCGDGIVLAADSQVTYGFSSKRIDADKVHAISFSDGHEILVAQAGDIAVTSRLIEIMKGEALKAGFSSFRDATLCAENAMRCLKKELIAHLRPEARTIDEMQAFYKAYDAALMMAFYDKGEPKIFTLDFSQGISLEQKIYATAGSGALVADYLILGLDIAKMNVNRAATAAIYIIDEVKKTDTFCNGTARVAYINKEDSTAAFFYHPEMIEGIASELRIQDGIIKSNWAINLNRALAMVIMKQHLNKEAPGLSAPTQ